MSILVTNAKRNMKPQSQISSKIESTTLLLVLYFDVRNERKKPQKNPVWPNRGTKTLTAQILTWINLCRADTANRTNASTREIYCQIHDVTEPHVHLTSYDSTCAIFSSHSLSPASFMFWIASVLRIIFKVCLNLNSGIKESELKWSWIQRNANNCCEHDI